MSASEKDMVAARQWSALAGLIAQARAEGHRAGMMEAAQMCHEDGVAGQLLAIQIRAKAAEACDFTESNVCRYPSACLCKTAEINGGTA